jgi:hypothetical protein
MQLSARLVPLNPQTFTRTFDAISPYPHRI